MDTGILITIGIFSGLSIILSIISIIFSFLSMTKSIGLEKSTHAIQYVPIDPEIDKENQEVMKNWATSEKAIKKEQEMYNDEISDEMPFFSQALDDKEVFSL